ncbi:MAG: hypothetical protein R6W68_16060 [Ignavibacteriaceae bacterium]
MHVPTDMVIPVRISGASFATSVTDVGHNAKLIYKKDQPRSIGVTGIDLLSD